MRDVVRAIADLLASRTSPGRSFRTRKIRPFFYSSPESVARQEDFVAPIVARSFRPFGKRRKIRDADEIRTQQQEPTAASFDG